MFDEVMADAATVADEATERGRAKAKAPQRRARAKAPTKAKAFAKGLAEPPAVPRRNFVSREGSMGEVVACLAEDQEMFAVLKMTELVQRISPSSVRYRITGRHVVVPATNLEQSVAWYWSGEEVIVLWK